jgi:tripartite ATP-independent transporter DctP family solute receptor
MLGTAATAVLLPRRAQATVFRCRQFHNQPADSLLHQALVKLWAAVATQTEGRFIVETFAQNNNIPGSDPEALRMLVDGELEFFTLWGAILGAVVPVAEIQALPYIFKNRPQVFAVMDGDLGTYLHREMAAKGIYGFPKGCFENGFRQISTRTQVISIAADLTGLKIRTPDSAVFTDFFKTLGATPQIVNFGQLYAALQRGDVDGQDNPLTVTATNRFYEVQSHISLTNHMWSGFNLIANQAFWQTVPSDIQEIIQRNVVKAVALQRRRMNTLNQATAKSLSKYGMQLNPVDSVSFRQPLAPLYARWKAHFGSTAWTLLEAQVGKIG